MAFEDLGIQSSNAGGNSRSSLHWLNAVYLLIAVWLSLVLKTGKTQPGSLRD